MIRHSVLATVLICRAANSPVVSIREDGQAFSRTAQSLSLVEKECASSFTESCLVGKA